MKRRFVMVSKEARLNAMQAVRMAPEGYVVRVEPAKRSLEQNARFHALCEDFARSGMEFAGKPRDAAAWKVLLVSGHAAATGDDWDLVEGLEGELVSLRESTAEMDRRRGSSLIEYSTAMAVSLGVRLSDGRHHE